MEIKFREDELSPMRWTDVKAPENINHAIAAQEIKKTDGPWGRLVLSIFKGPAFQVSFITLELKQGVDFIIESIENNPLIFISWQNDFIVYGAGLLKNLFHAKHINIQYTASGRYELKFKSDGHYQFVCIYLPGHLLENYKAFCIPVRTFLENINKNIPAALFSTPVFLPYRMTEVIANIIKCRIKPPLTVQYYETLITELLTLLVDQINIVAGEQNAVGLQCAEKAREIIVKDYEVFHTIKELARLCHTTEVVLQRSFRILYGQSVAQFSREARLIEAYRLLETTDFTLRVISIMVGYPDTPNFFSAFKNHYGFNPGKVRKRNRE